MRFPTTPWMSILQMEGDSAPVYEELVRLYRPALYEFAMSRGLGDHDAEDVVQETCFRFCSREFLARVDRARGKFRNFLLGVLCKVILELRKYGSAAIRDRRREIPLGDNDIPCEPQDEADFKRIWIRQLFQQAFDHFKGDPEMMPLRLQLEGKSYKEISAELSISISDVTNFIHRSKPRLKAKLIQLIRESSPLDDFPEDIGGLLEGL